LRGGVVVKKNLILSELPRLLNKKTSLIADPRHPRKSAAKNFLSAAYLFSSISTMPTFLTMNSILINR
jgi:hypothetical protein